MHACKEGGKCACGCVQVREGACAGCMYARAVLCNRKRGGCCSCSLLEGGETSGGRVLHWPVDIMTTLLTINDNH